MTLSVTSPAWQQVNMPALDLRRYLSVGRSEGVFATNDLAVAQRAAGANMSVDIAAGEALVQGDSITNQGKYYAYNDATFNLTGFTAANATNPRVDRVALRVRDAFHGDAANDEAFVIVTGTASAGATLSNLTGAAAVPAGHLLLANVLVPATSTSITNANIDTTVRTYSTSSTTQATTYLRKTTVKQVVNSLTETDLLNGELTVPVLAATSVARLTVSGDWVQTSGGAADIVRFKAKLGGTTLLDTNTSGQVSLTASSATRYTWSFVVEIANLGATNAQWTDMRGSFGFASAGNTISSPTTFATGEGAWIIPPAGTAQGRGGFVLGGGGSTVDTSSARLLEFTAILPTASASVDITLKRAEVVISY